MQVSNLLLHQRNRLELTCPFPALPSLSKYRRLWSVRFLEQIQQRDDKLYWLTGRRVDRSAWLYKRLQLFVTLA